MDVLADPDAPTSVAHRHVRELLAACGTAVPDVDADLIAGRRSRWPVWPQVALESLVGPPGIRLAALDLRWLHRLEAVVGVVDALTANLGGPEGGPTALSLIVERSQMLGISGGGTVSAGGAARMVRAKDGWVAVNLPRSADRDAVPALLDGRVSPQHQLDADPWRMLDTHTSAMTVSELESSADLLGMAVAGVASSWVTDQQRRFRGVHEPTPVLASPTGDMATLDEPLVVDLTSLWAGPLVGWYLARAGARVVKVESIERPDESRSAHPAFWGRLNGSKRLLQLELTSAEGRAALHELVREADIVLEASRPRAAEALGIDPDRHVASGGIWCSITGYGRTGPWSNRVAFGDDAAAAGGLTTVVDDQPWFIGDAAADPISGVTAAAAVLALWSSGRAGMVDVSMRDAVAHLTRGQPVASKL